MPRAPVIVFVSLLPLATACSERVPSAPRAVPALTSRVLTCRADVRAGTLSCAPAGATGGVSGVSEISAEAIGRSGSPPQTERILGGQGVYVQLTSSNASYNATTHIFQADVTVQNLIAWPLGTPDGSRLTGVKVFFYSGPSTVAGTGTVFVQNADGSGTFTATNQPYFFYNQILQTEDVSSAKTWEWSVPITVTTFAFEVLVDAAVPPMTIPLPSEQGLTGSVNPACPGGSVVNAQTLLAWGGHPLSGYTWTLSPGSTFPTGTTVDPLTGIFHALPGSAVVSGTYTFSMTVSDDSTTATGTFPFIVGVDNSGVCGHAAFEQSHFTTFPLPDATVGAGFGASLYADGDGVLPWTWSLDSGGLPPGLVVDQSRGVVRGRPLSGAGQTFAFTVRVVDATATAAACPCAMYTIAVHGSPAAAALSVGSGSNADRGGLHGTP